MGNLPSNEIEGDGVTFSHILTPGDRGEWPITAREGETIVVSASSTVFDPALEVVDSDNKIVAQNDDIRAGDQDALVVYRFPKAGAYKILVKGYKSAAGGQYRLTMRRFLAIEAKTGVRTAGSVAKSGFQWLRFTAGAGQTLVFTARASSFRPDLLILAPSGETLEPEHDILLNDRARRLVFRASSVGEYYVQMNSNRNPGASYAVTLAVAGVSPITLGSTIPPKQLEPGGLDIWTFEGKEGDLVHVDAKGTSPGIVATLSFLPPAPKPGEETIPGDPKDAVLPLASNDKSQGSINALLKKSGAFQVAISQYMDLHNQYTLSVTNAAKPWQGSDAASTLKIGESEYWVFEGKKGDIVRLEGDADQFDLMLQMLTAKGDSIAFNDDGGGGVNPLLTVLLPEAGRYIVQAGAYGNGGSGVYRLRKGLSPVKPLAMGAGGTGSIGVGGIEIWSMQGHAGETVIVSVRSDEFDTVVKIIGPDGLEVASNDDSGDGTDSLVSLKLPLEGTYTIWVSGKGSGKYKVRAFELDK